MIGTLGLSVHALYALHTHSPLARFPEERIHDSIFTPVFIIDPPLCICGPNGNTWMISTAASCKLTEKFHSDPSGYFVCGSLGEAWNDGVT